MFLAAGGLQAANAGVDAGLDRKMIPEPVMNAFLLARVYNALPANVTGLLVVLSYYILRGCDDRDGAIRPKATAVV